MSEWGPYSGNLLLLGGTSNDAGIPVKCARRPFLSNIWVFWCLSSQKSAVIKRFGHHPIRHAVGFDLPIRRDACVSNWFYICGKMFPIQNLFTICPKGNSVYCNSPYRVAPLFSCFTVKTVKERFYEQLCFFYEQLCFWREKSKLCGHWSVIEWKHEGGTVVRIHLRSSAPYSDSLLWKWQWQQQQQQQQQQKQQHSYNLPTLLSWIFLIEDF